MSEAKLPSIDQATAHLREQLNQDGHLVENTVSLIVQLVASARDRFDNPLAAAFGLADAAAWKRSKVPQQTIDRLETLTQILGNDQLAQDARDTAIYSSANQRRELEKTLKESFPALRQVALNMSLPAKEGEQAVTLGARIQALSPQK